MDGGEVLERLRAWSTVPPIVLLVRSSEVRLLEAGADNYVVKPFGMAEPSPGTMNVALTLSQA